MSRTTMIAAGLALTGFAGSVPARAGAAAPRFLQTRCTGGEGKSPKVLVAYASMHGSTGEVADTIAKDLCRAGASADARRVENVKDLDAYQAVIVGSAIKSGRWLPEAMDFVAANPSFLGKVPTAFFLTCLTLANPSDPARQKARAFLEPVLSAVPEVRPACIGLFAGVLDYSKYPRTVGAAMHYKMWTRGIEEGDYRDWQMVRDFSGQFRSRLLDTGMLAAG